MGHTTKEFGLLVKKANELMTPVCDAATLELQADYHVAVTPDCSAIIKEDGTRLTIAVSAYFTGHDRSFELFCEDTYFPHEANSCSGDMRNELDEIVAIATLAVIKDIADRTIDGQVERLAKENGWEDIKNDQSPRWDKITEEEVRHGR